MEEIVNTRRVSLFLRGGACLILAFASPALAQKGKGGGGAASRAIVTIHDTVPAGSAGVVSDGQYSGTYTDSQLTQFMMVDPCVSAFVKADGFFNIQMNFSPEFGSDCNSLDTDSTNRFYELRFPVGHAACTDSRFAPALPVINGVCVLQLNPNTDEPIIGIPKLFSASASQVRFRFKRNGSYWVVALSGVPVSSTANPQVKTVSYNIGTAKLFNDDKGSSGGYQVGADIPNFAVDITVERVP